ncbi:hypothetical protein MUK42_12528, partial [Musa troglodytarum]
LRSAVHTSFPAVHRDRRPHLREDLRHPRPQILPSADRPLFVSQFRSSSTSARNPCDPRFDVCLCCWWCCLDFSGFGSLCAKLIAVEELGRSSFADYGQDLIRLCPASYRSWFSLSDLFVVPHY